MILQTLELSVMQMGMPKDSLFLQLKPPSHSKAATWTLRTSMNINLPAYVDLQQWHLVIELVRFF